MPCLNRRAARDHCCTISCCGVLLADRNAHLLSGTVVNWKLRGLLYFWLPLGMFAVIVLVAAALPADRGDPQTGTPPTLDPRLGAVLLAVSTCWHSLAFSRHVATSSTTRGNLAQALSTPTWWSRTTARVELQRHE